MWHYTDTLTEERATVRTIYLSKAPNGEVYHDRIPFIALPTHVLTFGSQTNISTDEREAGVLNTRHS